MDKKDPGDALRKAKAKYYRNKIQMFSIPINRERWPEEAAFFQGLPNRIRWVLQKIREDLGKPPEKKSGQNAENI